MRGMVAKRLRNIARKTSKPTTYKTINGTVICEGYRRLYKDMKKERRK